MEQRLMTVSEVAQALRVSPVTIRRWIRLNLIRSLKLGRKRLVPREVVEDILRKGLKVEK